MEKKYIVYQWTEGKKHYLQWETDFADLPIANMVLEREFAKQFTMKELKRVLKRHRNCTFEEV